MEKNGLYQIVSLEIKVARFLPHYYKRATLPKTIKRKEMKENLINIAEGKLNDFSDFHPDAQFMNQEHKAHDIINKEYPNDLETTPETWYDIFTYEGKTFAIKANGAMSSLGIYIACELVTWEAKTFKSEGVLSVYFLTNDEVSIEDATSLVNEQFENLLFVEENDEAVASSNGYKYCTIFHQS